MKRILPFLLLFMLVIPVSAAEVSPVDVLYDTASVSRWDAYFGGKPFGDLSVSEGWQLLDGPVRVAGIGALDSHATLERRLLAFERKYAEVRHGLLQTLVNVFLDVDAVRAVIDFDASLGIYRLKDDRSGIWIVSQDGSFPYYSPDTAMDPDTGDTSISLGGQWIPYSQVDWTKTSVLSEYSLYDLGYDLRDIGQDNDVEIYKRDGNPFYKYIRSAWTAGSVGGYYVYCDSAGNPYVSRVDPDGWAQDQDNNWIIDDDGNTENGQLIDVDTSTVWFPDGTLNFINNLVYDESQKTYYVDASSSYDIDNNYYYTYNYHYEYHIDYTSITYIGQTAEYDEVYEYYYQLPDGRSSADLTAEELQALNTQIDVLPYIRSADDTSIRALYHFDGDTRDSSYWSHLGEFKWNKGASITYMDAGAFNGALYLDENEHEFEIFLPSHLASADFTIQWRYYQSHTLTPANDSAIYLGGQYYWYFNGNSIVDGSGASVPMNVGQWQEICFQRKDGVLTIFHNGIPVLEYDFIVALNNIIRFTFGSSQQTYKYFDELRITNKAVYPVSGYTPSSVPFDTNLALVLPDSELPVADEYWIIRDSDSNLLPKVDWIGGLQPSAVKTGSAYLYANRNNWNYLGKSGNNTFSTMEYFPGFTRFTNLGIANDTGRPATGGSYGDRCLNGLYYTFHFGDAPNAVYTFSLWDVSGQKYSYTFNPQSLPQDTTFSNLGGSTFDWGGLYALNSHHSEDRYVAVLVVPYNNKSIDFVHAELVLGNSSQSSVEFVSSVVVMGKDDLNTPSLAVRTDLDITGYQIGGVRPSLPTKGLVWALVEAGRISSLQIYNGQAWEEVDGRIWTGSRWVPYYAYDVLLLKDMWDIVEADPSLNPIYTEAGFWKWLQEAWGEMMKKLDQIIEALGGTPSTGESCSHTYESKISREATCSEPGHMTYTCSQCGHKYTELIDAHGHDWTVVNSVPDVLDEDGSVIEEGYEELVCTVCDTQSRDYGEGPEEVEFFDAVGDFIADGITWILDKLEELADSLRGITEIFNSFRDRISGMAGGFPLFFAGIVALLPEDLMVIFWFAVIGWIVLKVWKKWSN